jgi:3-hydroxybutyryl-CoA dehydrogenase
MTNKQIQSITVIGAGQMGHQIAMLAAFGGYETILQDVQEKIGSLNTQICCCLALKSFFLRGFWKA